MSTNSLELTLSLNKLPYIPKTISNLMTEVAKLNNGSDKLLLLKDFLERQKKELSWIQPFQMQLPECMQLLGDSIEIITKEIMKNEKGKQVETEIHPMMEDLLATRRNECQLFKGRVTEIEDNSNFQPFTQTKSPRIESDIPNLRINDLNHQTQNPFSQPIWKNNRRCWSPELHAMFLSALECLGGPEVATPKQIIEIMQVKGLTNDQVKSHLQKYRLHKRAVLAASTANPPVEMSLQNPKFEEVYFPELWMSINPHSDSRPGQFQSSDQDAVLSTTTTNSRNEFEEELKSWGTTSYYLGLRM